MITQGLYTLKCLNQTAKPFFLCWAQQVAHLSLEELGDTDGILQREPLLLNVKREREQAVGLSAEEGM